MDDDDDHGPGERGSPRSPVLPGAKIASTGNHISSETTKDEVAELLSKIPKLAKTFEVHRKIGEGTFSSVYLGSLKQLAGLPDDKKKWYAVKHLVPTTHPTRVAHELRCLRDIGLVPLFSKLQLDDGNHEELRELLKYISGKNHVIGVEFCFRNLDHVVFIMPYMPHRKFSEYVGEMDADELRRYMRALLTALRHVHTFGVIHRDVKPSNFLYDRERQRYALVDFGLAQHTTPAQPPPAHQSLKRPREDDYVSCPAAKRLVLDLTVRPRPVAPQPRTAQPADADRLAQPSPLPAHVTSAERHNLCACAGVGGACSECAKWAPPRANRAGTQGFRPPEVFFKYPHQSTAVDMWAAGVVLVSVLCGRYPFFRATDDMTALAEISALLGKEAMQRTAKALGCRLLTSTTRHGMCLRKLSVHLRSAPPAGVSAAGACVECRLPRARCVCPDGTTPAQDYDPTRTVSGFPDSAFALAARLLEPDPRSRITAADALLHPFLAQP